MGPKIKDAKILSKAYRMFLLELGEAFNRIKTDESYKDETTTFSQFVQQPEIGFTLTEVNNLMAMYKAFCLLTREDLPSHNTMKYIVQHDLSKDEDTLAEAQTLSFRDFKERHFDKKIGDENKTYRYEIVKRCNETGSLHKVMEDEMTLAINSIKNES